MQTFVWNNLNTVEKQQALTRPAISASNEIKSAVENIVKFVQQEGDSECQAQYHRFPRSTETTGGGYRNPARRALSGGDAPD